VVDKVPCACGCDRSFPAREMTNARDGELVWQDHVRLYNFDTGYDPLREHGTVGGSSRHYRKD
jgi:hypothetical protein